MGIDRVFFIQCDRCQEIHDPDRILLNHSEARAIKRGEDDGWFVVPNEKDLMDVCCPKCCSTDFERGNENCSDPEVVE